ncbi:PAS-domain containing protein [Sneathiella limimaris]|uniref:sensor histidine kinase n=1 Tax=Sneathiella limimaris TaxID=1964213 RepID=UPI00146BDB30|nr:PAS-domain containing protein [Sneathiella limimaris]
MASLKKYIPAVFLLATALILISVAITANALTSEISYFVVGTTVGFGVFLVFYLLKSQQGSGETTSDTRKFTQMMEAIDALDEGLVIYDINENALITNRRISQILSNFKHMFTPGQSRENLGAAFVEWLKGSPAYGEFLEYIAKVKAGKKPGDLQLTLPNGKIVSFKERYTAEGGVVSIFRDVTDEVEKRNELEATHSLITGVYQAIPIGLCVYDPDLNVVSWNEKYIEIMEVPSDTISVGMPLKEHLFNCFSYFDEVGDDPEAFAEMVAERTHSPHTSNIERKFKSGRIVEISQSHLPDGGAVCTFKDITLEKSTQQLLKESENRYRKMVELSPDAILVHKDGIVIYSNEAAIQLLEVKDLHSIVGEKIHKFFPVADHDNLDAHFGGADHLQPGQTVPTAKSQVIGRLGNRIDVELEASALLYGDRPVMQLIARDVSATIKAQKLLKQAKEEAESAAQLKGTFLANMSHELRTPLNAIIGFSEVIKNQYYGEVGSEKYIEYASDINASGVHLLDLINEILDLSKIESGNQEIYEETLDLFSLVEDCRRLMEPQREKADVEITSKLSSVLPNVVADSKMIKQVMINLLSNAVKFTPKGGQITISSLIERNGDLAISVEDTGIGIRKDDIEKALTPFMQVDSEFNRKYQGTGLGLPLSKNLMELHGGSLHIDSQFGSGTTVTIRIPGKRVALTAA